MLCRFSRGCCIHWGFYIKPQPQPGEIETISRCIIFGFYIKPQRRGKRGRRISVVSYLDSTSNHNEVKPISITFEVVSYLDSTSNHNLYCNSIVIGGLYHIWILHQTTTVEINNKDYSSCIIFGFYIKPQQGRSSTDEDDCCIIFGFYIKPQLAKPFAVFPEGCIIFGFYIKPQQLACRTKTLLCCIIFGFYIKPQQLNYNHITKIRCIIFGFYIKPQQSTSWVQIRYVVSYLDSTSNHNNLISTDTGSIVVSYLDSTSNHNRRPGGPLSAVLYHIWILHQTTTAASLNKTTSELYHIWILHQTTTYLR